MISNNSRGVRNVLMEEDIKKQLEGLREDKQKFQDDLSEVGLAKIEAKIEALENVLK